VKKTSFKVIEGGNFKAGKTVPTRDEVEAAAREAVLPSIRPILNQISERITVLYVEQAKTAVILNSLAELMIETGLISKQDLQVRVTKNQAVVEENYQRSVKEARANTGPKIHEQPPEPKAQTVCEKAETVSEGENAVQ